MTKRKQALQLMNEDRRSLSYCNDIRFKLEENKNISASAESNFDSMGLHLRMG